MYTKIEYSNTSKLFDKKRLEMREVSDLIKI